MKKSEFVERAVQLLRDQFCPEHLVDPVPVFQKAQKCPEHVDCKLHWTEFLSTLEDDVFCTWTQDQDGIWSGSCGMTGWAFDIGGPVYNGMKHCHNCGGKLTCQEARDEA